MMALVGQVIDQRYHVTQLIGEGGMGAVYRAEQQDGPPVAIKVLHEELGDQEESRARFEREARALFGLEHPNILHVHDFGIVDGKPYIAMELLEGHPLDKMVEDGPLEPAVAFEVGRQILAGLAYAHGQGALHRDLKTENVWFGTHPDGRPFAKLLDFGLVKFTDDERWGQSSKLTMTGAVFGTPAYMAPEQCAGAPVDARADVYSTGVILFELFSGMWPFMEETRMDMFKAHLAKPPPHLHEVVEGWVPSPPLDAVIQKALAKTAKDRFQNGQEMLAAFEQVPVPGRPMGRAPVTAGGAEPTKPFPTVLVASIVGAVLVLALAAAFLLLS
ncbi:MAG: hypothetical protein CMN30_02180 [Sandaracinus sp.]|nr:hypothetical protein [Sandaracinus sp.]|tara:strand:- start:1211 stop:2203 length:993 start_codon:yes stop_codon:yes gene_type:complete